MHPVDSSCMAAVGYDAPSRELWIEFTTGNAYTYSDVPAAVRDELLSAESMGAYFNRSVRDEYPGRPER